MAAVPLHPCGKCWIDYPCTCAETAGTDVLLSTPIQPSPANTPIEAPEAMLDGLYEVQTRKCHLCGKVKTAMTVQRVEYKIAFHYDRRHRGWTKSAEEVPPYAPDTDVIGRF